MKTGLLLSALFVLCSLPVTGQEQINVDDYLVRADFQPVPKDKLTPEELRRDISMIKAALKNSYGGREHVPGEVFSALEGIADNPAGIDSSEKFCRAVGRIMIRIPDYHLGVRLGSKSCMGRDLPNGSVGMNVAGEGEIPWRLTWRPMDGKPIPVLGLSSLSIHDGPQWGGFLEAVHQAVSSDPPAFIIDLRGNHGGYTSMTGPMAEIFWGTGSEDFPLPYESYIITQTPLAMALSVNADRLEIFRYTSQNLPVPDFLQKRAERNLKKLEMALAGQLRPVMEIPVGNAGQDLSVFFKHPVYLLTDRGCASACEATADMFALYSYAKRIGENTMGCYQMGGPSTTLVLAASNITIWMGNNFIKYRDGGFYETSGYPPDVRVPAGTDALGFALEYLKNNLPPAPASGNLPGGEKRARGAGSIRRAPYPRSDIWLRTPRNEQ